MMENENIYHDLQQSSTKRKMEIEKYLLSFYIIS